MADPSRPIVNPMQLWGAIQGQAQKGVTAAAFQQAMNAELDRLGVRYDRYSLPAVSRLWGQAKQIGLASQALARASDSDAITSSMIGAVPFGRTAATRFGNPTYKARVTYQTNFEGEVVTRSFMMKGIRPDTMTAGALRAQAFNDAQEYASRTTNSQFGGLIGEPTISLEAW
jgi:hypothetical protein